MHAVRLHALGPAENLVYERTEDPVPGHGQVRIAVAAAGVHLLDTVLREGEAGPFPAPVGLPTVPGREVAGTVDSVGATAAPRRPALPARRGRRRTPRAGDPGHGGQGGPGAVVDRDLAYDRP